MGRGLGAVSVVLMGMALAALIVATGPDIEVQETPQHTPTVPTLRVSARTVRMTVASRGSVVPKTESDLVAEVSGRVVAVAPSMVAGGFFARGDVLGHIESVDYEAGLEAAIARLASAQSELTNARKFFERQQELSTRESISQSQYDEALNQLTVAEANLRQATIGRARAERDLARTRLAAPYDGRVRTERVDVGQFVQRGEVIATLYSIEAAEVVLPIRDADLAFLPLSLAESANDVTRGPRVLLRARFAGGDREWEGVIVRTEGELDATTRMVHLIAEVDAPYRQGNGAPLVAGMFVEATILGHSHANIVAVPRAALQADGHVYVVGPDHRLEFRAVDVLRVTDDTAFLQGGVADGETVCAAAWRDAIDGQPVRPVPATDAPTGS